MSESENQTNETQSAVGTATGIRYGPAAAHAACIAPPIFFYFFGTELFGSAPTGLLVGVVVMLGCWAATLYGRSVALKEDPPDTYAAFQYKQAVAFGAASAVVMTLMAATIILFVVAGLVWLIVIGYSFFGAYQVAQGKDFRYAVIGKRLSA